MASITTTLGATFTPTKTVFRVQVNGCAQLMTRNSASVATWDPVLGPNMDPVKLSGVVLVQNDVIGAQYQLVALTNGTTIAVDE